MMAKAHTFVLYDDRIEIGFEQLEKIVQALVWLGDAVIVPSSLRADPRLSPEHARMIERHLAAFAEANYVELWDLEGTDAIASPAWLPSSPVLLIPEPAHIDLAAAVDDATRSYRRDILRGVGKKPGVGLDGITEFVTLRCAIWSHGIADTLGADHVLQIPQRSPAVPLRKLSHVRRAVPLTQELMELNGIPPLCHLGPGDIDRLRSRMPGARSFVSEIVERSPSEAVFRDEEALIEDARREGRAAFVDLVTPASNAAFRNIAVGWTVNLLGVVHPLLTALGFAQPVVEWRMRERRNRQIVTFTALLKDLAQKAEKRDDLGVAQKRLV